MRSRKFASVQPSEISFDLVISQYAADSKICKRESVILCLIQKTFSFQGFLLLRISSRLMKYRIGSKSYLSRPHLLNREGNRFLGNELGSDVFIQIACNFSRPRYTVNVMNERLGESKEPSLLRLQTEHSLPAPR